jgi:hypothetical protein
VTGKLSKQVRLPHVDADVVGWMLFALSVAKVAHETLSRVLCPHVLPQAGVGHLAGASGAQDGESALGQRGLGLLSAVAGTTGNEANLSTSLFVSEWPDNWPKELARYNFTSKATSWKKARSNSRA